MTQVSVVVASFRDRRLLDECLASLLPQCADANAELIVARAGSTVELAAQYTRVAFVSVPADTDLPRIRGAGLAAATGALALMTEDHCVAGSAWVATMSRYVNAASDVVGGGMDNAQPRRALDWGAFFAEYGFFSSVSGRREQASSGPTLSLTGANVAYSRRVLANVAAWMIDGAWENVVHDRLRANGAALLFEPDARVGQNLKYSLTAFMGDRYRHGHDYARARLAESPGANRVVRFLATPLLAPVLTWRVARSATGSRERRIAFLRAVPFTLLFLGAWAAGEAAGYLRGPSLPVQQKSP